MRKININTDPVYIYYDQGLRIDEKDAINDVIKGLKSYMHQTKFINFTDKAFTESGDKEYSSGPWFADNSMQENGINVDQLISLLLAQPFRDIYPRVDFLITPSPLQYADGSTCKEINSAEDNICILSMNSYRSIEDPEERQLAIRNAISTNIINIYAEKKDLNLDKSFERTIIKKEN